MSQRRFHEDSRLSENFTEQGLQSLTGESRNKWARYVVKELVDNSLEAAEDHTETPAIDVAIHTNNGGISRKVSKVVVEDNGPGIDDDGIETIFEDVSTFAGSKRHYCLPSRGNQGNALMTILGIQYLSQKPLVVESQGTRHYIQVVEDDITSEHNIERATEPTDVEGTRIVVDFHSGYYCRYGQVKDTLGAFVALNPHVDWHITVDESEYDFEATEKPSVEQFSLSKSATTGKALWFSYDDFKERLKADARAAPSLTVEEIATEFAKLTSKGDTIFEGLEQHRNQSIDDFLRVESESQIRILYSQMVAETSTYSERTIASTLGSVGDDLTNSLYNYLRFTGQYSEVERLANSLSDYDEDIETPGDMTVYYRDGVVVESDDSNKVIPFTFELAAIPKANESQSTSIEFGINQSVSYSAPRITLNFKDTSGKEQLKYGIASAFGESLDHGYHVVTNLTCPNLDFQDKGKQSFNTEPFEEGISTVVGKAIRKLQREIRPSLNDLRSEETPDKQELQNKAPRGFIKDFFNSHFQDAYNRATENEKYTIKMRQLYYEMRPMFHEVAESKGYQYACGATVDNPEPLEFDYEYFENTLVPEYEENVLGERVVHRDKRGFFVEPHSNERVKLQTVDVEKYDPDLDKFDTLLFVEKAGYFEQIHKDFELTKKYDIGLINSRGYSTLAGRKLIEKVQQRSDVDLLILTDLDIDGLGIADDATEAGELSAVSEFDGKRIGISLSDVEEYDLPIESRNYTQNQVTQLMNRVEDGEIKPEVAAFLRKNDGQAVEINALTPAELKTYLMNKFEEYGVEKVLPDEDDIEDPEELEDEAISRAVGSWVKSETKSELDDAVSEAVSMDEISLSEIQSRILEKMDEQPTQGWQELEGEVQDGIKAELREEVREYLDENVTVEITIDD